MSKKDIEINVRDTDEGAELLVGNKVIGAVNESANGFIALANNKELGSFKTYDEAEEAVIRDYNLSH